MRGTLEEKLYHKLGWESAVQENDSENYLFLAKLLLATLLYANKTFTGVSTLDILTR